MGKFVFDLDKGKINVFSAPFRVRKNVFLLFDNIKYTVYYIIGKYSFKKMCQTNFISLSEKITFWGLNVCPTYPAFCYFFQKRLN